MDVYPAHLCHTEMAFVSSKTGTIRSAWATRRIRPIGGFPSAHDIHSMYPSDTLCFVHHRRGLVAEWILARLTSTEYCEA
jgi:hypothetical protein